MSSSSSRRARWKGTRRRAPSNRSASHFKGRPGFGRTTPQHVAAGHECPVGQRTKRTLRQTCPRLQTEGAICVQRLDDSRNSAIHTTYRSLLRSSSTHEPRGPPLEVVSLLRCLLDNKDQPKPMRSTSSSTKKSFKNRGPAASRRGRRRDLSRRLASPSDPRETSPETRQRRASAWCTEDQGKRFPRSLTVMILPQVHLRKPCYDFYFL